MLVIHANKSDYPELIQVWEDSVRATHFFLTEEDIARLRKLILAEYFDAVEISCVKNSSDKILGFCGVSDDKIEMLFVAPESRGQGVGACLCNHVIRNNKVNKVDVNEQNPQAVGFYEHMGFIIVSKSDHDGQGNHFPLLHMELTESEPCEFRFRE